MKLEHFFQSDVAPSIPNCNAPLPGQVKFCPQCGANLAAQVHCTECGAKIQPWAKFCPECGAKVSPP
jgi:RNA polymerase subunit RPABC4/transcription elongation factor Spt4